MSEKKSPLARLVLFMVCLSIAGVFVSGIYTYTAGPQQNSLTAPENGKTALTLCLEACDAKYWRGTTEGVVACAGCYNDCVDQYAKS